MPLSFPSSPVSGQTSSQNGRTYQWSGYSWDLIYNVTNHASNHASTGTDPVTILSSQISNFNSSVSGLVSGIYAPISGTVFTGSISSPSGNFTSSLQVNGTDVSISGHTHTSSSITNFNSSVSGLLPVTNIASGSGILVNSTSGTYTINANIDASQISTGTLSDSRLAIHPFLLMGG